MREHTEQMELPRFLWVPFELGRPFGAPNAPAFQRRVLLSALELLESEDGPVLLTDFPDEAPLLAPGEEGEAVWACPLSFHPPPEDRPELVAATLDEMERLAPWHEVYVGYRGSAAPAASGLTRREIARLLGEIAQGDSAPRATTEHPIQEWLRLGCDDLRTWYMEAAQGQPGRGSPSALREWFWTDTGAARLIGAAAGTLLSHPVGLVRVLARRALVPREFFLWLVPGAGPNPPSA